MDETIRALTDLAAVDDQLSKREALLDGLATALEMRRAALREVIPGTFLAAYDALSRAGRRPAVVPVRGSHCGGCYLRLLPHLDSSIRRRQSLCPCPHCRRLLYLPARVEEEEEASGSKGARTDRPATNVRPSKRVRRATGTRPARQQPPTAGGRDPRGKRAPRDAESRGTAPLDGANPAER